MLVSNILVVPSALILGIAIDRLKSWKLQVINAFINVTFLLILILAKQSSSLHFQHTLLAVGLCGFITFNITTFLVSITIVSKVAKQHNRGIVFGAYSLFGTLGIMLVSKVGGHLYDTVWHYWPFMMTLIVYATLIVVTCILALFKKIDA